VILTATLLLPGELCSVTAPGAGAAQAATSAKHVAAAKRTAKKKTTVRKRTTATSKSKRKTTRRSRGKVATRGVNARAAVVVDARTGEVLYDKNSATPMPIASLTKLMTAMVFLESEPDLARRVMVTREDLAGSGHTQLRAGEVVSLRDLLHGSLLSSDNAATKALVRNSGIDSEEYLARMNRKSQVLGLHSTHFVEFTGLSEQNVSTAQEYAQLLKTAGQVPMIAHITTLPDYTYRSSQREHHLVNTNRLARYGTLDVNAGKTGFISQAGYCLATWVSTSSRDVIAVVLGAPSNPARFAETRRLIERVELQPAKVARPS
jgi:D-alanyl-D-alanine endopeptidase (penicillin-binding protein 7)